MNETNFTPINKAAAIVVSKGFEYESGIKSVNLESKNPLKTVAVHHSAKGHKAFIDFTGHRYARFTVIGLYAGGRGWVVRCDCGVYCIRQSKGIKNPNNVQDRCAECRYLAFIKMNHKRVTTGRDFNINDF